MTGEHQIDLFLDTIADAPMKAERAGMEYPFFSLQKTARMEPLVYDDGKVKIEIKPGSKGIATIWDKDILLYCASLLNERLERGKEVDRVLHISAHDLLKVCNRGTGKRSYELLMDALERLRATTIITSIAAAGEKDRSGFGWIDNFRALVRTDSKGNEVMYALQVTLNDWLYRAIVKERRVLTISKDYFRLTGGIERRLYEIARKHCGRQREWRIGLPRLAEKCGSERDLRKFKADLKKIIERGSIPDYDISLAFDPASRAEIAAAGLPTARYTRNQGVVVVVCPKITSGTTPPEEILSPVDKDSPA